jgi:hypothetical protein
MLPATEVQRIGTKVEWVSKECYCCRKSTVNLIDHPIVGRREPVKLCPLCHSAVSDFIGTLVTVASRGAANHSNF